MTDIAVSEPSIAPTIVRDQWRFTPDHLVGMWYTKWAKKL